MDVQFDVKKPASSPGLSSEEAAIHGLNRLTPPKKVHPVIKFIMYMLHVFNVMLWVSGLAAYLTYGIDPVNNPSNVLCSTLS
jgi:sodium/potassium-transporting ATPase subunit alpha